MNTRFPCPYESEKDRKCLVFHEKERKIKGNFLFKYKTGKFSYTRTSSGAHHIKDEGNQMTKRRLLLVQNIYRKILLFDITVLRVDLKCKKKLEKKAIKKEISGKTLFFIIFHLKKIKNTHIFFKN